MLELVNTMTYFGGRLHEENKEKFMGSAFINFNTI